MVKEAGAGAPSCESLSAALDEFVTDVAYGLYIVMVGVFYLAAKAAYVDVHGAVAAVVVISPDMVQQ